MINDVKYDAKHVVNYSSLLNCHDFLIDNGGLMLINLLILLNVKEVLLAGFDGYSTDDQRRLENDIIFEKHQNVASAVPVIAVTPTLYNIESTSIYAL